MNFDMNDPNIQNYLNKIISQNSIGNVLHKINDALIFNYIKEQQEYGVDDFDAATHRTDDLIGYADEELISYFSQGACNVYAYILCKVFEGHATAYEDWSHVATKIGDYFYDYCGVNYNFAKNSLREYETESLIAPRDKSKVYVGFYEEKTDGKYIEIGVNAGRKYIYECVYGPIEEEKENTRK